MRKISPITSFFVFDSNVVKRIATGVEVITAPILASSSSVVVTIVKVPKSVTVMDLSATYFSALRITIARVGV